MSVASVMLSFSIRYILPPIWPVHVGLSSDTHD